MAQRSNDGTSSKLPIELVDICWTDSVAHETVAHRELDCTVLKLLAQDSVLNVLSPPLEKEAQI